MAGPRLVPCSRPRRGSAKATLSVSSSLPPIPHLRFPRVSDYNDFVNSEAREATYNGLVIHWAAIASTESVNAIDNVGGVNFDTPVYLPRGELVTPFVGTDPFHTAGLWSGHLEHAIDERINGQPISGTVDIWTGSAPDGLKAAPGHPIGVPIAFPAALGDSSPVSGLVDETGPRWITFQQGNANGQPFQFYAISEVLSAVPEPASYRMMRNIDRRSHFCLLVLQTQGSAAVEASGADRRNRVSGTRMPRLARTVSLPSPGGRSSPSAASTERKPRCGAGPHLAP